MSQLYFIVWCFEPLGSPDSVHTWMSMLVQVQVKFSFGFQALLIGTNSPVQGGKYQLIVSITSIMDWLQLKISYIFFFKRVKLGNNLQPVTPFKLRFRWGDLHQAQYWIGKFRFWPLRPDRSIINISSLDPLHILKFKHC